MKKEVRRSRTSSRLMPGASRPAQHLVRRSCAPPLWVEHVLETVPEQVEAEDGEGDRQAGERVDPPVALKEVLQAHADHHAPLRLRYPHAEADEGKARSLEDRPAALQRRDDDDRN